MRIIPLAEIKISFARSSGAGGQNVNKTSTKVLVRWPVDKSAVFSATEKSRIITKLSNKLNYRGEIVIAVEQERSQLQNREIALALLQKIVSNALRVPKKRVPTKPSLTAKLKRLASKKLHAKIKSSRKLKATQDLNYQAD